MPFDLIFLEDEIRPEIRERIQRECAMEALIADIDSDMRLIGKELDSVKRKLDGLKTGKDRENIDSHNKAVAASLHSIYSGYENVLERIIKTVDRDLPMGTSII